MELGFAGFAAASRDSRGFAAASRPLRGGFAADSHGFAAGFAQIRGRFAADSHRFTQIHTRYAPRIRVVKPLRVAGFGSGLF